MKVVPFLESGIPAPRQKSENPQHLPWGGLPLPSGPCGGVAPSTGPLEAGRLPTLRKSCALEQGKNRIFFHDLR